ncbi:uncharacterized protein LOC125756640, partial [Rhipicephalus sanguineus]|uniref:uncharacterized protein LOC125756640 n=1 Tax=Rhipicephalus sanguineus TaxID=34632 RepID=UPI0020C52FEF
MQAYRAYEGTPCPHLDEPFGVSDVRRALHELNGGSAPGPDRVSNKALRNLEDDSVEYLTDEINKSWKGGDIPEQWKLAKVILIPKPELSRPVFLVEPPNRVVFSNATGAHISCSVSGSPKPLVTWHTHQGHAVDSQSGVVSKGSAATASGKGGSGDVLVASATPNGLRRVLQDGTLMFRAFGESEYAADVHHATYRCSATNSVGTIVSRDVKVRA